MSLNAGSERILRISLARRRSAAAVGQLVLAAIMLAGCGTTRMSDTQRTATDQRGLARSANGTVDIGAVEVQPAGTATHFVIQESPKVTQGIPASVEVAVEDDFGTVVTGFTGTVLFSNVNTGQRSNRFDGTLSHRWAINGRLTNELRGGLNGGTLLFFDALAPGLYSPGRVSGRRSPVPAPHFPT